MPDLKISELESATTLDGSELIPGVQDDGNVSITVDQIATYIGGSSPSGSGSLILGSSGDNLILA